MIKKLLKKFFALINLLIVSTMKRRDSLVCAELSKLQNNSLLLDAGCRNQVSKFCNNLIYKAPELGEYDREKEKYLPPITPNI